MRESIGAAAFIQILMIFIVIFISFLAVSVNFATAFRVKNKIISYIEANEGLDETAQTEINTYLSEKMGYDPDRIEIEGPIPSANGRGNYYTVTTHMNIQLPFLGPILQQLAISGETKIIFSRE
jgi:hypothetical protein